MPRKEQDLALDMDPGSWQWEQGWFAEFTSTVDDYPSLEDPDPIADMRHAAVRWALRLLPHKYREALELTVMAGRSAYAAVKDHPDIASRQTLSTRVNEGVRLMEASLSSLPGWLGSPDTGGRDDEETPVANPPKQKGTRRERLCKSNGIDAGLQVRRSENNLECRDLDVTLADGSLFVFEVKDRQRLDLHGVAKRTEELWGEVATTGVIWHRTKKPPGGGRLRPAGPTLMCLREEDGWALLAELQELRGQVSELKRGLADMLVPA